MTMATGFNTKFLPTVTAPRGFSAASVHCGIKANEDLDLLLITAIEPCSAAGVFTRCELPAAAVTVSRDHLRSGRARAIVCNSGNANAGTGRAGLRDALRMCERVGRRLPGAPGRTEDVLICSTGVIGHRLPIDGVIRGIDEASAQLARGRPVDRDAAKAILTTDLVTKSAAASFKLGGRGGASVRVGAIAKGSGMIAPNMATMLAFVTTDVAITPRTLKKSLQAAVNDTFNRSSVDAHTSPSDSVLVLASGLAGGETIRGPGKVYDRFCSALTEVCGDLAYQIVKDGEGATRVMRVSVQGAPSRRSADRVAKAVVDSPLVKAAVHGGDPNWGRVTTAAAGCGVKLRAETLSLWVAGKVRGAKGRQRVCVFRRGSATKLAAAAQDRLNRLMHQPEVTFELDLGLGDARTEWLGCDLSAEYVRINADYTS